MSEMIDKVAAAIYHSVKTISMEEAAAAAEEALAAVCDGLPKEFAVTGVVGPGEGKRTGERVWLYFSPEGGGWWQWGPEAWRRTFKTKAEAERVKRAPPGPWFSIPTPDTVKIVSVPNKDTAALLAILDAALNETAKTSDAA